MEKYKLAILESHPIQYHEPLLQIIAKRPDFELKVYFCWDFGIKEPAYDAHFDRKIKWDTELLQGYEHEFLKNYSLSPSTGRFFGLVNPGVISKLWRGHYDAVLISGYTWFTNWLAFFGAWVSRTPIIFRGETDLSTPRSFLKRALKKIILVPLLKTAGVVLYSCSNNKEYYKHYGVPEEKLISFPCAVDNSYWRARATELKNKKDELKNKLGVPNGHSVILHVAKLMWLKRQTDLLKAYGIFKEDNQKTSLVIVGDGHEREKLKDYAKENNLKDVYFAGFKNQSELPPFYSMADVFVLMSEWDRSPKVVNEAMNFELPIIVTDRVGTGPDLVKNGENGFIYPLGDVETLVEDLKKILTDKKSAEMGKMSLEIVSRWSFEEDAKGVLKAMECLYSSKRNAILQSSPQLKLRLKKWIETLTNYGIRYHTPPREKEKIIFTFDDGPLPSTPDILDLLDKHNKKALFFLVAERVKANPQIAREIIKRGHTVGSHGFDHINNVKRLSLAEFSDYVKGSLRVIEDICEVKSKYFRPPKGRISSVQTAWLLTHGYILYLWSVGVSKFGDFDFTAPETRGGTIILLHDDSPLEIIEKTIKYFDSDGNGR